MPPLNFNQIGNMCPKIEKWHKKIVCKSPIFSKYSSLSSLIASTIAPIYFIINTNNYIAIFWIYLFAVIVVKHSENIKRLLNRTENKIKLSK